MKLVVQHVSLRCCLLAIFSPLLLVNCVGSKRRVSHLRARERREQKHKTKQKKKTHRGCRVLGLINEVNLHPVTHN